MVFPYDVVHHIWADQLLVGKATKVDTRFPGIQLSCKIKNKLDNTREQVCWNHHVILCVYICVKEEIIPIFALLVVFSHMLFQCLDRQTSPIPLSEQLFVLSPYPICTENSYCNKSERAICRKAAYIAGP